MENVDVQVTLRPFIVTVVEDMADDREHIAEILAEQILDVLEGSDILEMERYEG